jgi:hypothetical protein
MMCQVARALRKSGAGPAGVAEQLQWWAGYADVECFNQLLHVRPNPTPCLSSEITPNSRLN